MSFAGRPQELLDAIARQPTLLDLVAVLVEDEWTEAELVHLLRLVRRTPLHRQSFTRVK